MKKFNDVDKLVDSLTWDYNTDIEYLLCTNGFNSCNPLNSLEKEILNFRHLLKDSGVPSIHSVDRITDLATSLSNCTYKLDRQRQLLLYQGLTDERGFATVRTRLDEAKKNKKPKEDNQ